LHLDLDCLRVNKVARRQVCDLWFNYLMWYGVPGFNGALAACVAAGHAGAASRAPRLLLTVVVTLGCLRVNEVARLQVCYRWFNYLMLYGAPGLEGSCLVHINRRKNVTQRKGHYPPSAARGIRSRTWRHSCAAGWSSRGLRCIRRARKGTAAGRARMPPPAVHSAEG
jgi:hypothetical protein